jgi:hypothetical protein
MQGGGGQLCVSGGKICEAENECTDIFHDPPITQPLPDGMIPLCACPCALYRSTWGPSSTKDCPCVSKCDTDCVGDELRHRAIY